MKNKTVIFIIAAILIVGGYYWLSTSDNAKNEAATTEQTNQENEMDRVVRRFVEEYQPNTNISSDIRYTFQLEDALINENKPVVFTATLDDIFRENGKLFLRFAPSFFDFLEPRIFYTLDGCTDKIDGLINQEQDHWGEYAVVATITNIEKPVISVEGFAYTDEVELELAQSQTYLAKGTCLDLEYVEGVVADTLFD